jgi:hypothetical protein
MIDISKEATENLRSKVTGQIYIGDAAQGRKLIEPLLRFGAPHCEHTGAQPYTEWQKAFDPASWQAKRSGMSDVNGHIGFRVLRHDDAVELLRSFSCSCVRTLLTYVNFPFLSRPAVMGNSGHSPCCAPLRRSSPIVWSEPNLTRGTAGDLNNTSLLRP